MYIKRKEVNIIGKLTKMHVGYEILNPPQMVKPRDILEGKIIVMNNDEVDLKLKELFIEFVEYYDEDYGEGLSPVKNKLQKYYINTRGMIESNETQEYNFKIRLPKWKRRRGRRISNWNLQLRFKQKTKLIASRGSISRNATCILPVKGSMSIPSFGSL